MRTTAMLSLVALSLLFTPALSAQEAEKDSAEESTGIKWTEDYSAALETAKAENKRLFIEFTATW
jgi:thiol:disulfide interchange protein